MLLLSGFLAHSLPRCCHAEPGRAGGWPFFRHTLLPEIITRASNGCGAAISFDCSACHAVSSPRGAKDRRDDRDSYSILWHGQRQHFRGPRLRGFSVEALTDCRRLPRGPASRRGASGRFFKRSHVLAGIGAQAIGVMIAVRTVIDGIPNASRKPITKKALRIPAYVPGNNRSTSLLTEELALGGRVIDGDVGVVDEAEERAFLCRW